MATKKAAKGTSNKTKASKSTATTSSSQKAAATQGKCYSWKAWLDLMPPNPGTLHVRGKCRFPKHGYKVTLKKAVPQGINPAILLLQKVVRPPTGQVIQTPEVVEVNYKLKTKMKYTHVTILPEVTTIRVQIVS